MAKNELYDKNGKSTTDQNEIIEIEVDYYKKLNYINQQIQIMTN
jgi:hypothetical protein